MFAIDAYKDDGAGGNLRQPQGALGRLADERRAWWWSDDTQENKSNWWYTDFAVWTPAAFEERIARQHGAFLIGGVPTGFPNNWYLKNQPARRLTAAQVREVVSIPLRCHAGSGRGRPPDAAVRTFRVDAAKKADLRRELDQVYDLSFRTLFPDLAGFAAFGTNASGRQPLSRETSTTPPQLP